MQNRVWGERIAKAGIYVISSLVLFAFVLFYRGAQQYRAAAVTLPVPQTAQTQGAQPQPAASAKAAGMASSQAVTRVQAQERDAAGAITEDISLADTAPEDAISNDISAENEEPAEALQERKVQEDPQPETLPATQPHTYGQQPDAAALQAEVERMAAMGFSLSGTGTNYVGSFYATSYCCEVYPHICGGNGVTASGTVPTPGLTVAADWNVLSPGTWIYIGGVGIRRVEDSGSAIQSARLDVAIDTHANALAWGGQGNHEVWILG